MKAYFLAEKMKCKRTSIGKIMVFMPVFTIIFSFFLSGNYFVINSSNWWYMMMFPGMVSLICGVIIRKDKKLKNHAVISLPVDIKKIWDGKVLYGIWVTGAGLFLMFLLLAFAEIIAGKYGMVMEKSPSLEALCFAGILLFFTFLWQIPFCMFLAETTGTFLMILLHMILYNISVIYVSLKPFYMMIPGANSARIMCAVLGILPNNLLAEPGAISFSPELLNKSSIWIGTLSGFIWFFLFWYLGRKWYGRQDGK